MSWNPLMIERVVWVAGHAVLLRDGVHVIRRTGWVQAVAPNDPQPSRNTILHSVLSEVEVDSVIERVLSEHTDRGASFSWHLTPLSSPPDLQQRLRDRGFREEPVRYLTCRPAAVKPGIPTGIAVEPVDPAAPDAFLELALANCQDAEATEADLRFALADPNYHFFLARVDDTPAGVAGYRRIGRAGWLFGAHVAPALRGRGAYRGLVSARLEALRKNKISSAYAIGHEDMAAPILERLGMEAAGFGVVMFSPSGAV